MTLYDSLKSIEAIPGGLKRLSDSANSLHAVVPRITIPQLSDEDLLEAQREAFNGHRDNPFLERALKGEQPLLDSAKELTSRYKGLKAFLPRRKDEDFNKQLESFGELVPFYHHVLRSDGVFPIGSFQWVGKPFSCGVTLGGMSVLASFLGGGFSGEALYYGAHLASLVGLVSSAASASNLYEESFRVRRGAKYLDGKIEELDLRQG